MIILSAKQLYEADAFTIKKQNITSTQLMERAGEQVYNWLAPQLGNHDTPIKIFCGIGNNGGDGLVIGRLLIENGFNVTHYIVNFTEKRSKDFLVNYDRIKNTTNSWPKILKSEDDFPEINSEDIVIDAIFGIGLNRPPSGWVKKLIKYINEKPAYKIAVDIPSGLYADKPVEDFEAVLKANYTLTFTTPKLSFFLPETGNFVPFYALLDIGLDFEFITSQKPLAILFSKNQAKEMLRGRNKFSHKGDYGHSLLVGGSYGKIGATVLASRAALKSGAGLVTAYIPKCGYTVMQTSIPEVMVQTDENQNYLTNIQPNVIPDVIGIGVGMGINKVTVSAFKKLLESHKKPMVIDADAITILAKNKSFLKLVPKDSILTPHPGELKRLIGDWKNDYDKIKKSQALAKKYNLIIVIKGAYTAIITPEVMFINTSGNPGMATAGSGDVLTGVITGLLSQGYFSLEAALLGVYLHGLAGDLAVNETNLFSLLSSEIIDYIGEAYRFIIKEESDRTVEGVDD